MRDGVCSVPWQKLSILEASNQIPLGENLVEGEPQVEVESLEQIVPLKDFVFSTDSLSGVQEIIATPAYSELLTDVRMDMFSHGVLQHGTYKHMGTTKY